MGRKIEIKQVKFQGEMVDAKKCTQCERLVPLTFYPSAGGNRLRGVCKICHNAKNRDKNYRAGYDLKK